MKVHAFSLSAILIGVAHGAITNLAASGTALSSPSDFGSSTLDANDGDRDGAFGNGSVYHSQVNGTDKFWQVDLGSDQNLDRVLLFPRTDVVNNSFPNATLTVTDSASSTVFSTTFDNVNGHPWGTVLNGVVGQTVRLDVVGADAQFFTFAEMEVWGDSAPLPSDITQLGIASADSSDFGGEISYAVDGIMAGAFNDSSVFHSGSSADQNFYRIDYASDYVFDSVQLFDRTDSPTTSAFTVSVLDSGGNMVTSQTVTPGGIVDYDRTIDFGGTTGRTILIEEANQAEFLAFSEVRVLGEAIPEPSTSLLAILALTLGSVTRRR